MNISCSNQDPCPVILDSKCVIYEGENLLYIGVNTNDNFRVALQNINTAVGNLVLGGGITELVGDVVAVGPGIAGATLATVNSTPGQFGSSTAIPKVTVDAKGRVTAISTDPVFIPSGALNFIGDVTGSGNTGSDTTLTLKTVNSNVYTTNNFLKFAVNAKGLITSATPVTSSDIITTLGYTPYNSTNPAGYISGITGSMVVTALGYTPYDASNPAGYISTISGIIAGGELAGTYPNPTLVNAAVTAKVLTGVNVTGGSISATDSILEAFGKVQNQINGLIGGSIYQGTWNASTNTPTLISGVGTKGYYYIVNNPGSTNLDGITDWELGDWAIFDGTAWQQVDNTDAVVSVNGFTGAVSLTTDNISEGLTNQYFTTSRARLALSGGTGISYDNVTGVITNTITQYTDALARQAISLTTTGTSGAATYDNITGVLNIPNYASALTGYIPYTGATQNVDLGVYGLKATTLSVNTTPPASMNVGDIVWNPIDGTFDMTLLNGVTLQAGQELHFYGKAVGAIGNGQAVMFAGVQGDHLLMTLADPAVINANPEYFIGIATQDFANNEFGYVTILGSVRGLNTLAYTLGEVLYFDSTAATPGLLTGTRPVAPNAKIEVCAVVRVHGTQGILKVRPHVMPRLSDVQDVYAPTIVNNDILAWNTNRWEARTITDVLGYTPANDSSVVHLAGTETVTGNKTFSGILAAQNGMSFLNAMPATLPSESYTGLSAGVSGLAVKRLEGVTVFTNDLIFPLTNTSHTFPLTSGTIALTSDIPVISGTTNYVPKFTASGTLGDSLIYDNGSSVAIGTNNPLSKFHVQSQSYLELMYLASALPGEDSIIYENRWTYSNSLLFKFYTQVSAYDHLLMFYHPTGYVGGNGSSTQVMYFETGYLTAADQRLSFQLNGNFKFYMYENGEVVVGPESFYGDGSITDNYPAMLRGPQPGLYASNTRGGHLYLQGGRARGTGAGGDVIIKTGITSYTSGNTLNSALNRVVVKSGSGNVGIGMDDPSYRLDVSGDGRFGGSLTMGSGYAFNFQDNYPGAPLYTWLEGSSYDAAYSFFAIYTGGSKRVNVSSSGVVTPGANGTQDLGSTSLRWATVYTSDLDMSNGVGDYTIVEGKEDLFLYNNITKKVFKFALIEVDPSEATPKLKK